MDLPIEILENILKNLEPRPDLYDCQTVCKSWNEVARTFIYETIEFWSRKSFDAYTSMIQKSPHGEKLSKLAKTVFLQGECRRTINDTFLAELGALCSNIEKIETIFTNTLFYQILSEAVQEGYFSRLKIVDGPKFGNSIWPYVDTALLISSNLENLVLRDRCPDDLYSDGVDTE